MIDVPKNRKNKTLRISGSVSAALVVAIGGLWSTGCSSTSVSKNYPSTINPVIAKVKKNEPLKDPLFVKETQSKDKTLYLMERGRVAQMYGAALASKTDYDATIAAIRENDEKAKISVSDTAAQAAAVLLNDNAIPYEAAGYERVMLRYLQTVNYLSAGDLDGARVEIVNADAEQKYVEKEHAKEIRKAEQQVLEQQDNGAPSDLPDFGRTLTLIKSSLTDKYAGLDEVAGKVKNSFQNGAAYYLSGLVYESLKDNNNAYISYKQALELFPENKTLQKDVARLAMLDARADDLEDLKSRFGLTDADIQSTAAAEGSGRVVVLYENEFVAQKQEIKIPVPLIGVNAFKRGAQVTNLKGIVFIAFPIYDIKRTPATPLSVKTGDTTGETMPVCYVNALAVKNLKERAMPMVIRQVIRCVAKAAVIKAARDQAGEFGMLVALALAGAAENADLRSWLTLPQDIQVYRTVLAAGDHQLMLNACTGTANSVEIKVESGKTTLVRVVGTGSNLSVTSSVF